MRNEREANLSLAAGLRCPNANDEQCRSPECRCHLPLRPSVPLHCRDMRWMRGGFIALVLMVVGFGWLLIHH